MSGQISSEAKVGLFVLVAVILACLWTFRIGTFTFLRKEDGFYLKVTFDSVPGLDKGAKVKVNGVDAGKLVNIKLVEGKPEVTLQLNEGTKIWANAEARIKAIGLMGEKYVEIYPGTDSYPLLKNGESIKHGVSGTGITDMGDEAAKLIADVSALIEVMKDTAGERLGPIMDNIEQLTRQLANAVEVNQELLQQLMININSVITHNKDSLGGIISNTETLSADFAKDLPEVMGNMQDVLAQLKSDLASFEEPIGRLNIFVDNLNQITDKINKGEGTLGKFVTDDKAYEQITNTLSDVEDLLGGAKSLRLFIGFRPEYLIEYKKFKSYFHLKLTPREDKYYLVEIIDDFRGETKTTETIRTENNVTNIITEKITKEKIKLSVQIARRFHHWGLRGGLMESSGGVGIDYYYRNKDNLSFSLEGWDFSNDDQPHLKLATTYLFKQYFSLKIGWDDFADSDEQSFFAGLGFAFEDKDLKALIGTIPIPGF
ncbi:MAG: MlaD family protein [bacterium]